MSLSTTISGWHLFPSLPSHEVNVRPRPRVQPAERSFSSGWHRAPVAASVIVGAYAIGALTFALAALSPPTYQARRTLAAERTQDLAYMIQAASIEAPKFEVAPNALLPITARTHHLNATAVPAVSCAVRC